MELVKGKNGAKHNVIEAIKKEEPTRKVFVALPAYAGQRTVPAESSLLLAQQIFWIRKLMYIFEWETKCPYVSMARNNLVSAFLQTDCTEIIFLDADVGFNPEAFAGLLDCDVDLVAGVYPKKNDDENDWPIILETSNDGIPIIKDGLLKAVNLPTGFMKIKRSVIEKLMAAHPELRYLDALTGRFTYNLFGCGVRYYDPITKLGRWFGDDYGFCDYWQQLGGDMWVLPDINFEHAGPKAYKGNYYKYLTNLPKQDETAPIQKALTIDGWTSFEELTWLKDTAKTMNNVVEIGSYKGRNTIALALGCPGPVIAVDHWEGDDDGNGTLKNLMSLENTYEVFIKNVADFRNVNIMRMPSLEAAQQMNGSTVDMVFIDGEHTYEACKADIEAWLPNTKKLICGHDYSEKWPGVMKAVDEIIGKVSVKDSIWYKELEAANV